jgi:hypothetical protein
MNSARTMSLAAVVLITASLVCGAVYLWSNGHTAPDPTTAEPTALITYILSDEFAALPDEERKRYMTLAMKRVSEMTDEQADKLRQQMKQWKKDRPFELKMVARRLFTRMIVAEARQYVQVPAEQRSAWLDERLPQWMAMMPKPRTPAKDDAEAQKRQAEREKREREGWKDKRSHEEKLKEFQDFSTELTSAEERSMILSLMQDAGPKFKTYFKKQKAAEKKAP